METEGDYGLPEVLQQYHSLYPLEDLANAGEVPSQAFGVATQVVKAISSLDGQAVALRRVDGRQVRAGMCLDFPWRNCVASLPWKHVTKRECHASQ